jgi:hypothetical protein
MFRRNLVCFGNESKQDHDLAKVGVEGSSPFARSKIFLADELLTTSRREAALLFLIWGSLWGSGRTTLIDGRASQGYAAEPYYRVWNAFWAGGIANPLEVIEQITYLLFMRGLDDAHTREENKANRLKKPIERRIFPTG